MRRVVCLLTAGLGTRMGRYADLTNKALLPVRGKAIISHIIDQFPVDTEFIVAVGYKHEAVQTYLSWAHPHRTFTYVLVDNYAGPGSGPAYSVQQCASAIRGREFTLIVCDGYYECLAALPYGQNVVGIAQTLSTDRHSYCNVQIENHRVVAFYDKQDCPDSCYALCGVYHIADVATFFAALSPPELSSGLSALTLSVVELDWRDLGTETRYDAFLHEQFGFIEGGNPNLKQVRREYLFVQFLENLDKDDAELILAVKDKKIPYKGITKKFIEEVYPGLLEG